MDEEHYHPRNADDMIDITKVLIGISSDGYCMSWAMLEETNKYLLNSNKNSRLYKDILIESEYFINEQGEVVKRRLSPNAIHKDEDVGAMKSFSDVKTIRELIEVTNKFFSSLELTGYTEEIKKIRELHKKILSLYESIDRGNTIFVSAGDLQIFFDYIINLYTYAFGNPINEDVSLECYDEKQRPLDELIDINNICIGKIFYEDSYILKVLEKTNNGYCYKDKNGNERRIDIYKNILYDTYYYVLDNGEIYNSNISLLKRSKSESEEEKEYLSGVMSLEEAVNLTIERATQEDTKLDMNQIEGLQRLFKISKRKDKQISFTVMELIENDSLLVNCYKKAITDEPLTDPNNVVVDISAISDILSNMAYTLKK